ncbi:cytochrome P450 [Abortiporus biennis]|nr:cytochrome P450 [Abortiporus biennis]
MPSKSLDFPIVVFPNDRIIAVLALSLWVYAAYRFFDVTRRYVRSKELLFPGPKGLPLIGNVMQIGRFPWYQMTKWSQEFGPVYSLNLGGQYTIVLNSHKAANDLLDKRSAIYSDRPRMIVTDELLCQGLFLPCNTYGDGWRKLRKAANEVLNHRAVRDSAYIIQREAAGLAQSLIQDSADWNRKIVTSISSVAFAVGFGSSPLWSKDDVLERTKRIEAFMLRIEHASRPGAHFVEIFPWLAHVPSWFPGAGWKKNALDWHEKDSAMFVELYREAEKNFLAGKASKSFVSIMSENDYGLTEKERAWMAGVLYGGGTSTTSAVVLTFILAMASFPDVMKKAQAQIDKVVGRNRMPNITDKADLPYIRALIREVFRWRCVGPTGLPHYTMEDDIYEGHLIPKGTLVFYNNWAMNRDERYPEPDVFRPERFLDETETKDYTPAHTHMDGHTTFGFGRRKCPAHAFANEVLFLTIVTLLWSFDINKGKDENGNIVIPDIDDLDDFDGLVVVPKHFPCDFIPRSSNVPSLLATSQEELAPHN